MDGYRADGYYYDWLERQWVLPVPRKLTLRQKRVRDRRKLLLRDLVVEIENGSLEPGSGLIRLYATLTAKALLQANPEADESVGTRGGGFGGTGCGGQVEFRGVIRKRHKA